MTPGAYTLSRLHRSGSRYSPLLVYEGYKPGEAKSADEYANLDAEDESLARWKASLGIVPGATAPAVGPKVHPSVLRSLYLCI